MSTTIRALIVDDQETNRFILHKMLQGRVDMQFAADGEEAVQKYLAQAPDIILLDLVMPRMDGLQVISYIRESANDNDVYILVMTAAGSKEVMVKSLNLGANDYVEKPLGKEELLARIRVAERQQSLLHQSREAYSRISRELDMISSLQGRLLPTVRPDFPGLNTQTMYIPSGMASGDYYDFYRLNDHVFRFAVADVSGHGARAAFIMAMVRTVFRVSRERETPLEEVVSLINSNLCQVLGEEKDFVTFMACDLDLNASEVRYVNAGHCPGMMLKDGREVVELDSDLPVLGFFDLHIESRAVAFNKKCGIFLYTDGFYEWTTSDGELFGEKRFSGLARELLLGGDFYLEELKSRMEEFSDWGASYRDDLTALWVEFCA